MNSWHSWSSNGRWLVFSSKANTAYTQLFLTHIDENGESTPPVVLDRFTGSDRAANIPEFVPLPANAIARIKEQFLDNRDWPLGAALSLVLTVVVLAGGGAKGFAHLAVLRQLGCDVAQGYYFSRPMPADAVPAFTVRQPEAMLRPRPVP